MISLTDRIPKYLLGKYQLITTVMFTALFSIVFLLMVSRFFLDTWFSLDGGATAGYTVAFFTMALGLICLSKRLMYVFRNRNITLLGYFLWNIFEVILIALIYTLVTLYAPSLGLPGAGAGMFAVLFPRALLFSTISLGVPYILISEYFAIQDRDNTIRVMNYASAVTDLPFGAHEEKRITLTDNSGVIKLSLTQENLYYIESDDNYVKVWYTDASGSLKQYMLRCRLKTIEESFADSDLVRCHRKFMVNIRKVEVLTGEKDGYYLTLDMAGTDRIPVSKTYEASLLARFNER